MKKATNFIQKELEIIKSQILSIEKFIDYSPQYTSDKQGELNFLVSQKNRIEEILIEVYPLGKESERNSFSDCVWGVVDHLKIMNVENFFSEKVLTEERLGRVFESLPDDIQNTAYEWGASDTCFRDAVWNHLNENEEDLEKLLNS